MPQRPQPGSSLDVRIAARHTVGPRRNGLPMVLTPPQFPEESLAVYAILKQKAREIAAHLPTPDFYHDHAGEMEIAFRQLDQDALLVDLRRFVTERLEDDFGHGIEHALKVATDAGALVLIEGGRAGHPQPHIRRASVVCQAAGLMHDIHRKRKDHAIEGARFAREALSRFAFDTREIDAICAAIRNHEAFQRIKATPTGLAGLLSDCLYDADKFRWGPDNFTDTLWDMVAYFNPALADFVARYPGGMERLEQIKTTFRSHTGKKYGPQMIDLGIGIGKQLMTVILTEFNHMLE